MELLIDPRRRVSKRLKAFGIFFLEFRFVQNRSFTTSCTDRGPPI